MVIQDICTYLHVKPYTKVTNIHVRPRRQLDHILDIVLHAAIVTADLTVVNWFNGSLPLVEMLACAYSIFLHLSQ